MSYWWLGVADNLDYGYHPLDAKSINLWDKNKQIQQLIKINKTIKLCGGNNSP